MPLRDRETRQLEPSEAGLADAAALLRGGGLVALPTETVYGLAADATSGTAVAGIYAAKERPSFNPLIAHLPDLDERAQRKACSMPMRWRWPKPSGPGR